MSRRLNEKTDLIVFNSHLTVSDLKKTQESITVTGSTFPLYNRG